MWLLQLGHKKVEMIEKNVINIKTDISETITVPIFLKKQYAEKEYFEAALKIPEKSYSKLVKRIGN